MDQNATMNAGTADGRAPDGLVPSFLAGLAQAMHTAASIEREHIAEVVAGDAQSHVEKAHARAVIEAGELRRLADEDIRGIEVWAAAEIERVHGEAARRTAERRSDLASYLRRHDTIIATEIAGVETAMTDYAAELDRFIEGLIRSSDPAEIARRAESLPTPPDLDEVRAGARAGAVGAYEHADDPSESDTPTKPPSDPGVGVMDPDADGRPGDLPLAVDPLQVPEDEPAVFAATAGSADHANGAIRLIRALAPWATASSAPTQDDAETQRG